MEVLEVDKVGVYDNFFERGGHSLLATQVVSRLADELQIDLPLRRLFAHPTVGELAEAIMGDPDMRQQIEPMLAVFAEVSELSEDAVAIMLNESPADAPAAMGV
jgi:acyl carrier protein